MCQIFVQYTKAHMNAAKLRAKARATLKQNDTGSYTRPAPGLYPNQWLWDSCFIAIGIATYNPARAAEEIHSLLKGQWRNGMVPNIIFHDPEKDKIGIRFWDSKRNPNAPKDVATSGITQPPMIAEACWQISRHMNKKEARAFLKSVYPKLLRYHQWLYRERDPDQNGSVALFHPWETGLDNTPGWIEELEFVHMPWWIKLIEKTHAANFVEKLVRRDIHSIPASERLSTRAALRLAHVAFGLRKRDYDAQKIMRRAHFVIESLSFNSILLGNNMRLEWIADEIGESIPQQLQKRFERAKESLNELWSEEYGKFCHRNYLTGRIVEVHGIAQLLPLYSGAISKRRAGQLVKALRDPEKFWLTFPVPSVPKDSRYFRPRAYWQGPTWINTNWLLIDGLRKYGYEEEAEQIRLASLELAARSGMAEYFSPLDGSGAGTQNFSWTAALILSLLSDTKLESQ